MTTTNRRIYNWAIQRTESSKSHLWIGLLFLLELILFIPLDAILLFFCLQNRSKIPYYILIAALASTLSGLCGFLVGHLLWDLAGHFILNHFIAASSFERFAGHYQVYENWAIFLGSLIPFPLKILSLSAGIFHLGLPAFLSFLFLARSLRFTLIGIAMYFWGDVVKGFIDRHFNRLLVLVGAKVALGFAFFWAIAN